MFPFRRRVDPYARCALNRDGRWRAARRPQQRVRHSEDWGTALPGIRLHSPRSVLPNSPRNAVTAVSGIGPPPCMECGGLLARARWSGPRRHPFGGSAGRRRADTRSDLLSANVLEWRCDAWSGYAGGTGVRAARPRRLERAFRPFTARRAPRSLWTRL